jgi:hypothetical protein
MAAFPPSASCCDLKLNGMLCKLKPAATPLQAISEGFFGPAKTGVYSPVRHVVTM